MTKRIAAILLFGILALSPGLSQAKEDGHSLEQLAVEMAQTPEQHTALANHFRAKAAEARAEIQRHEAMGTSYSGGSGKVTWGKVAKRQEMQRHCQNISKQYSAMAADYDALAKLHEEQAKTP